ncbi:MAG: hypothetical protein K2N47_01270, partial [Clostridia bacterium]|nr:hypothetical protein [Clostridia bacterium]
YPQWNFTPADRVNYAEIPGAEEIYYQIDVIEDVTIEWRDPNAEDNFIYTTSSVDKFKEKIIVTGILTSGKKVEDIAVTEYDVAGGAASWSSVGSHDIFVSVKTKTPDGKETTVPNSVAFRIEAKSRSATHITYTLKDPDKIYEATVTFDDIKANDLEVTAFYNDGNSEVLKPGDYTLTNISTDPVSTELSVGENITILITHDGVTEQFVIKEVIKSTHAVEVTFADVTVDYGEEYTVKITGDLPDGVSVAYEYRVYSEEGTENPDIIDAPTDAGKYTVTAIFTVDEDKYEAIESLEMTLTINKIAAALSDIEISGWTYGEAVSSPKVTAAAAATEHLTITYYKVSYKYSEANPDAAPEEELIEIDPPTSFLAVGTYCVKAEVLTDNNIDGEEKTATFTITARAITVTIDSFVGYKDENLKTLTATVTDGTLADGQNESDVFSLTSPADKNVAGVYSITGNVLNDNYDITFVGGENAYKIYQTVSVGEGALLGGQVDIAADGEYTLVVTAVSEDKIYGDLEGDLDIRGFKATLYKKVSGDVYVEVTDIPTIVRLAIPEGMTDYKFYSVDGEGATHEAEFKALEGGLIEFAYSGSFPMEFVYTAPIIRAPAIPWWVWLIAVLAVIAIIAIIAELAVRNKRPAHDDTAIIVEQIYNDEELKRILAEHGKRLADLEDRDNDGFDDPYEGGYNFA